MLDPEASSASALWGKPEPWGAGLAAGHPWGAGLAAGHVCRALSLAVPGRGVGAAGCAAAFLGSSDPHNVNLLTLAGYSYFWF